MRIFKLLIIYFCVLYTHETVFAAKRIKRNFESDGNHTRVSNDFAVIQTAGNKSPTTERNLTKPHVEVAEMDKPMDSIKSIKGAGSSTNETILMKRKLWHGSRSISKPKDAHTTHSRNVATVLQNFRRTPMAYVYHGQENKSPEYVDHIVAADEKLKEAPAEVVIIDNAPNAKPLLKGEHNNLHQCLDKSLKRFDGETDEPKYILKGLSHILNTPDEHSRTFAATKTRVFENQFKPLRNPPLMGRFAYSPLERMFKLANMFMYNIANDDQVVMRNPGNFLPRTPFNQPEDLNDEPETIDYILNVVGNPEDGYNNIAAKSTSEQESDAFEQHSHDAALIFKQPVPADDNKVVDLIENALDTLLTSSNEADNNDEIEVRCPIHHEKKLNFAEHAKADGNKDGDFIQVCSCHIIQKKKADDAKTLK